MFSTGEEGPEDGRGMESRDGLVSKQAQTPSSFSSFFLSHDQKGWNPDWIWEALVQIQLVTKAEVKV